jgi:predicted amidohydrolase
MATFRPVTVAALEVPHRFGDVEGTLARVDNLLGGIPPGVDLVLLPECALTGYVSLDGRCDLTPFAEPLDGPTAKALAGLARRHRVALAGPLVERDQARIFNTLLLFDAAGRYVGRWRKRHPWYPEHWASPGDLGTPVVTLAGLCITACICFDVHFVAQCAAEELSMADVLLFPSAWVEAQWGEDARASLLGDLARRFALTVVNANWGPGEPAVPGQGGSRVVLPSGEMLPALGGIATATVLPSARRGGAAFSGAKTRGGPQRG